MGSLACGDGFCLHALPLPPAPLPGGQGWGESSSPSPSPFQNPLSRMIQDTLRLCQE